MTMSRSWLRQSLAGLAPRKAPRRRPAFQPLLEALETRCLPAQVLFGGDILKETFDDLAQSDLSAGSRQLDDPGVLAQVDPASGNTAYRQVGTVFHHQFDFAVNYLFSGGTTTPLAGQQAQLLFCNGDTITIEPYYPPGSVPGSADVNMVALDVYRNFRGVSITFFGANGQETLTGPALSSHAPSGTVGASARTSPPPGSGSGPGTIGIVGDNSTLPESVDTFVATEQDIIGQDAAGHPITLGSIRGLSVQGEEQQIDNLRALVFFPNINVPPTIGDVTYTFPHGATGPLSVGASTGLLQQGRDPNGLPLTAELVTGPGFDPGHGTITAFNAQDGSFTYTPTTPDGRLVPDSFAFRLSDGTFESPVAFVHLQLDHNVPPRSRQVTVELAHGAPGPINGSAATTDLDGDPLTYSLLGQPLHDTGTVTVNSGTGEWSFDPTPAKVFEQEDLVTVSKVFVPNEFVIRASDGYDVADVTVFLDVPNRGPAAAVDDHFMVPINDGATGYYSGAEPPGAVRFAAPGVLWKDHHLDDHNLGFGFVNETPLTAILIPNTGTNGPFHGSVTLRPDGSFTYTPDVGFRGQDSFRYEVTDGAITTDPATVKIDVDPGTPVLHDQVYVVRPTDDVHHQVLDEIRAVPSGFRLDVSPHEQRFGFDTFDIRGFLVQNELNTSIPRWETNIRVPPTGNHFLSTYALRLLGTINDEIVTNFATASVSVIDEDSDGDGINDREEITNAVNGDFGGKQYTLDPGLSANAFDACVARVRVSDTAVVELKATTPGATLAHVQNTAIPHPQDAPPGETFPVGFFSYQLITAPGGAATLEIILPPGVIVNDFWKYGPTADVVSPHGSHPAHWYPFLYSLPSQTGAEFSTRVVPDPRYVNATVQVEVVTLHFIDGQRGDDDLTANDVVDLPGGGSVIEGVIADPGGPGLHPVATSTTVSASAGPSVYGRKVTFTAVVTPADAAAGLPTGSVQFRIDGKAFGSPVVLHNGRAVLTTAALSAGVHQVVAFFTSNSEAFTSSDTSSHPFSQRVAPAPLTITAQNRTVVSGRSVPALTVSYRGLANGDTPASLTRRPTVATTATAASPPGTYRITVGGAVAANYTITFVPGTLTVLPDPRRRNGLPLRRGRQS
jgi:hypothetical protein